MTDLRDGEYALRADLDASCKTIAEEFKRIEDRIDLIEGDDALDFRAYCAGFEHLCAGVLKLKNYCGHSDDVFVDGLKEIFEKIKEKI